MSARTLSSFYAPDLLAEARRGSPRHLLPRGGGAHSWCDRLTGSMRYVYARECFAAGNAPSAELTFSRAEILDVCCPACKAAVLAAYLRLEGEP